MKLGVSKELAYMTANCRRGYWWISNTLGVKMALTKERLISKGDCEKKSVNLIN